MDTIGAVASALDTMGAVTFGQRHGHYGAVAFGQCHGHYEGGGLRQAPWTLWERWPSASAMDIVGAVA